jgi:putative heme-binding domain-containing protein
MDKYLDYALTKTIHALRPTWEALLAGGKIPFAKEEHLLHVLKSSQVDNGATLIRERVATFGNDAARSRLWLAALAAIGNTNDLRLVLNRGATDVVLLDALAADASVRKLVPAGGVNPDLLRMFDQPVEALRLRAIRLAGLWKAGGMASRVESLVTNSTASLALRSEALAALVGVRGRTALPALVRVAESPDDSAVALAALEALAQASIPDAARVIVKRLANCANPTEAGRWLRPLSRRVGSAGPLTKALAAQPLSGPQARHALSALSSASRYEKALIEKLTEQAGFSAELPVFSPEFIREVVEQARSKGSAAEGKKHYDALACAACHTINGTGGKAGPDLSALGRGLPVDMIVTEVIWPQLNVKEGFEATSVTTRDGQIIEGIKHSETAGEIAIRDTLTGEVTSVPRAQVAKIKPTGSVMPEGLIAPLTRPQLADLIRFLSELGK